jgi:hypothetical protein
MSHSASANPRKPALLELEKASGNADPQAFAFLTRTIDWSTHGAAELTRAIDLALALDMVPLARDLAQQGNRLFPEDQRVQQAMTVLAPPIVVGTYPAQETNLEASQQWIEEQASQYKGQWIAVQNGLLLGSAPTLQALHRQIGPEGQTSQTIVVKVLA